MVSDISLCTVAHGIDLKEYASSWGKGTYYNIVDKINFVVGSFPKHTRVQPHAFTVTINGGATTHCFITSTGGVMSVSKSSVHNNNRWRLYILWCWLHYVVGAGHCCKFALLNTTSKEWVTICHTTISGELTINLMDLGEYSFDISHMMSFRSSNKKLYFYISVQKLHSFCLILPNK